MTRPPLDTHRTKFGFELAIPPELSGLPWATARFNQSPSQIQTSARMLRSCMFPSKQSNPSIHPTPRTRKMPNDNFAQYPGHIRQPSSSSPTAPTMNPYSAPATTQGMMQPFPPQQVCHILYGVLSINYQLEIFFSIFYAVEVLPESIYFGRGHSRNPSGGS